MRFLIDGYNLLHSLGLVRARMGAGGLAQRSLRRPPHAGAVHRRLVGVHGAHGIRAGLCRRPEDWPWGSFAGAMGTAAAPPFFDASWTLRLFSEDDEDARRQLARFVAYEPDYVRF